MAADDTTGGWLSWFASATGIAALGGLILKALTYWYCQLSLWALDTLGTVADLIDLAVPDELVDAVSSAMPYVQVMNCWVPVGFAFQCFAFWGVVFASVTTYRFLKSWLPGIGG